MKIMQRWGAVLSDSAQLPEVIYVTQILSLLTSALTLNTLMLPFKESFTF